MKKLTCYRCGCYLGEMEKGRLHRRAALLCEACFNLVHTNPLSQLFNMFSMDNGPLKKQVPEE